MRFVEVIFSEFGAPDPGDIQGISGALWEFVLRTALSAWSPGLHAQDCVNQVW